MGDMKQCHTENTHILGTPIQNFVAQDLCTLFYTPTQTDKIVVCIFYLYVCAGSSWEDKILRTE